MPTMDDCLDQLLTTPGLDGPLALQQALTQDRAIVELKLLPGVGFDTMTGQLAAAFQKLKEGKALSADERRLVQYVTLLVTRPSLFVRDNHVVDTPRPWLSALHRLTVEERMRSVGRVNHADGRPAGTGFLVAPRTIMTNNHVLCSLVGLPLDAYETMPDTFAQWVDMITWAVDEEGPTFSPHHEHGAPALASPIRIIDVQRPLASTDIALLMLDDDPPGAAPLPLSRPSPGPRRVYVVGYPTTPMSLAGWEDIQRLMFGEPPALGVKRFAPGMTRPYIQGEPLFHDATTLGGSSGSPIIDAETHQVVAIHHYGSAFDTNQGVVMFDHRAEPILSTLPFEASA